MSHPLLPAAVLGILAIAVGLSLQGPLKGKHYSPPPGYPKGTLGLEFIPDSTALQHFFGEAGEQTANIEAMKTTLLRDNFFALAYTLFLVVFAIGCWTASGKKWYWLLVPLAILAGVSDLIENSQTQMILSNMQSEDLPVMIHRLHFWVWTKSFCMALLLLGAASFLRRQGWVGKALALLAVVAVVFAAMSVFRIGLFEIYALLGLTIFFPLLVLYCLFFQK